VKLRVPRGRWVRIAVLVASFLAVAAIFSWRGPTLWHGVGSAFSAVRWEWVAVAISLNLASVVLRSLAWDTTIRAALPPPRPDRVLVFSAFSVGLFANAVLPGRIGELARVAVLTRKVPARRGLWATLVGTVFAHRVFDIVPVVALVLYVLLTAKIPSWAYTSLLAVLGAGVALFAFAFASARRPNQGSSLDGVGAARRVVTMARHGLSVLKAPIPAAIAILFQMSGWLCQLLAVYTAMRAFHIHSPLPAAGLVLLLMNVATIFPLWPGNVGLVQAAVALPLVQYGVAYPRGIAYGFGLQAIEASVGVGVGLIFLAREGLSFAMLRVMPDAAQAEVPGPEDEEQTRNDDADRARMSG
jgi:uncharacterized protein (TIRG00374 family)